MRTSRNEILEVAIKTLVGEAAQEDKVRFLQEGAIMAQFKHPNVVNMYGVVKRKDEVSVPLEAFPNRGLLSLLIEELHSLFFHIS